ncbi:MAG: ABC transporter substrate-binding protein [Acidimicrobiia bacterium]
MRDKTIRSIGATLVLFSVGVAALTQLGQPEDPIQVAIDPGPEDSLAEPDSAASVASDTFIYRMGVLAGVTTDNFWAFYAQSPSVWDAYILGPTKPALYTLDPTTGATRPELATSEIRPTFDREGWRVRVTLNDHLRWSDGEAITADDVVFTFETVRRLGLGGTWALSYPAVIESVHADSPTELRIEFTERPSLGVWPNAVGFAPVMPEHFWQPLLADLDATGLYQMPGAGDPGGGPLVIDSVGSDLVVSLANRGYAIGTSPDRVEYHVFPDETAAVAALENGTIDSVLSPKGLTSEHIQSLADAADVQVSSSPANGVRYLGFNLNREPMSDNAFRTSLALLLDREAMAEAVPMSGSVANSFVGSGNSMWYDPEAAGAIATRYQGDLAARLAAALDALREAGYTWSTEPFLDGGTVTPGAGLRIRGREPAILTILTPGDAYDPARPLYAAEIAEALGWLGFEVRPVETDFDTVVDLAFTPGEDGAMHYDMYLLGWTLGSSSLPDFYRPLFAPNGVQNNTGYNSGRFNQQLERFESSFSFESAREALWSMETILAEDLPYLLLYTSSITEAFRSDRVNFDIDSALGGLQGRLGGIGDVKPAGPAPGGTLAG